jgi:hypothetical protein
MMPMLLPLPSTHAHDLSLILALDAHTIPIPASLAETEAVLFLSHGLSCRLP